jgi:hypothetical protein
MEFKEHEYEGHHFFQVAPSGAWPTQEQFDAASALGSDRARAQIAAGCVRSEETPLSGEWADSPSPRSVAADVGYARLGSTSAVDGVEALADAWENGYFDTWEHQGA